MQGDFSRFTFDPLKGFSRVLLQQGRVLLDADWNEQGDILLHLLRTLGADLIGPHGGPRGNCAFGPPPRTQATGTLSPIHGNSLAAGLQLSPGHYYVDGLLVEVGEPVSLDDQPYLPGTAGLEDGSPFLLYLDVWERHVTALDDDAVREVALGGPDTATRTQVVWQVRVLRGEDLRRLEQAGQPLTCQDFPLASFRALLGGRSPRLRARSRPADPDEPCVMPAESRFRGHENQLYRVEIHSVDEDGATFKWSRENGSVAFPWLAREGDDLIVGGLRDRSRGFAPGDWVELCDEDDVLSGEAGVLVQVVAVEGDVLTIDPGSTSAEIPAQPSRAKRSRVRRWDQRANRGRPLVEGAIPVAEGDGDANWISLEDGIELQFLPADDQDEPTRYRVGDFWLIPARVTTGDIIWPQEDALDAAGDPATVPKALVPHGVRHHYAPLWLVPATGDAADLRRKFDALAVC